MSANLSALWLLLRALLQRLAFGAIIAAACLGVASCVLAAFGVWPWLGVSLSWGTDPVAQAGMWVQIGLTTLAVMLMAFLPSNARIMALENSHRRFQIGMEDVARAYHIAHAADRSGTFRLSSEFDAVRERLAHLRTHPDLDSLEPALLEIAAQMSHVSRELAEVYSDENVARARAFLHQRQQEVERFDARLAQAKSVANELRHWLHQVELEESVAASQLERLRVELDAVLPDLGIETVVGDDAEEVVMRLPRAAE